MVKFKCITCLTFVLLGIFSCSKEEEVTSTSEIECSISETEQFVVDDLSSTYAHKFENSNPTDLEYDNLEVLINFLGDAQFVGMGESTHGTSEFFQMKDKIFRNLVEEKDFDAIVFEIPWGNALVVDDFVFKNIGNANSVIDQTVYWVYDTQEVRDLATWIHTKNQVLEDNAKIHFVGCDVQGDDFLIEVQLLRDYFERVAADSVVFLMDFYDRLPIDMQNYSDESEELHDDNISGVEKGYNYIVNNKEYFISLTSEYEYEVALMASHVIKEREFVYRTNSYGTHRDMLMAFYSEWWQRILAEDAKVAIWAHNAHVFDGSSGGSSLMGTFLSGSQGDNYRNLGFSFGKGSANAFLAKFDYSFSSGVRSQIISDVPCNTSNFIMNEVDGDQFYIIFDELDGPSKTYFNSSQPFLQFGGGFNPTFINNYIFDTNLVSGFDVMIHFDETQASVLK